MRDEGNVIPAAALAAEVVDDHRAVRLRRGECVVAVADEVDAVLFLDVAPQRGIAHRPARLQEEPGFRDEQDTYKHHNQPTNRYV